MHNMRVKISCVLLMSFWFFFVNAVEPKQENEEGMGALVLKSLMSAINFNNIQLEPSSLTPGQRLARASVAEGRKKSGKAEITWNSCGNRRDPMQLQRLDIKPNPVRVPGKLRADLALLVKEPISAPIKVTVQVQKRVDLPLGFSTWLELPCPGDSCSVRDACSSGLLPAEGARCPAPTAENSTLNWRECACPIPKGLYAMPPLEFNITSPSRLLPEYLLNGGFYIKLRLSRRKKRLACVETTLDLDL